MSTAALSERGSFDSASPTGFDVFRPGLYRSTILLEHSKMLESLFDGNSFLRRARFSAFDVSSIGSSIDRQTVEFFAMGDPASFRSKTELLLHPSLDFQVGCKGAHGGRVSSRLLFRQGRSVQHQRRFGYLHLRERARSLDPVGVCEIPRGCCD